MTEPDRILAPDRMVDGARQTEDPDAALRPKTLAEFVGQAGAKDNLRVFIESARSRREAIRDPGPPRATSANVANPTFSG